MKTKLILGGPGSGKTTRLLELMGHHLNEGIPPDQIAFASFTKQATQEAKSRMITKFDFGPNDLPYVRTIHSLCFWKVGARRENILTYKDYKLIAERLGIEIISGKINPDDYSSVKDGDLMVHFHNLSRTMNCLLKDIWLENNPSFSLDQLWEWVETCEGYKRKFNKMDFTDLLAKYVYEGFPIDVDVAFIDEAQDLTPLEWDVLNVAFPNVNIKYIAGDDDQAIYKWSGADVDKFLNLKVDEKEVLPISYRLPKVVFQKATSFAKKNINQRYHKAWEYLNMGGFVKHITSLSELNLHSNTWFLLSRNSCFLTQYSTHLIKEGFSFNYKNQPAVPTEDISVIQNYLRWLDGEALSVPEIKKLFKKMNIRSRVPDGFHKIGKFSSNPPPWFDALKGILIEDRIFYKKIIEVEGCIDPDPRISLNTIHGVKGGEADYVVITPDMTLRTFNSMTGNEDDEGRVFYVGLTRAMKGVYILTPTSRYYYQGLNEMI